MEISHRTKRKIRRSRQRQERKAKMEQALQAGQSDNRLACDGGGILKKTAFVTGSVPFRPITWPIRMAKAPGPVRQMEDKFAHAKSLRITAPVFLQRREADWYWYWNSGAGRRVIRQARDERKAGGQQGPIAGQENQHWRDPSREDEYNKMNKKIQKLRAKLGRLQRELRTMADKENQAGRPARDPTRENDKMSRAKKRNQAKRRQRNRFAELEKPQVKKNERTKINIRRRRKKQERKATKEQAQQGAQLDNGHDGDGGGIQEEMSACVTGSAPPKPINMPIGTPKAPETVLQMEDELAHAELQFTAPVFLQTRETDWHFDANFDASREENNEDRNDREAGEEQGPSAVQENQAESPPKRALQSDRKAAIEDEHDEISKESPTLKMMATEEKAADETQTCEMSVDMQEDGSGTDYA